jgi:predicted phage tail component-like protein
MTKENRMPDFTNHTITVSGREGIFDFGETIGERKIEISCFIPPGKGDADFLTRKDEIIAWLNPDIGLCPLILDKEPGRIYQARLEGGFSFDKAVRNSCTFDLVFFCPDPYAYAKEDECYEITETGTHEVIRDLGNASSLPVYSLTADLPKEKHVVLNTNGKIMQEEGPLSENEILVIDSSLMTAKVIDAGGNMLRNGLPLLSAMDFPFFKPGTNTIVIEADDGAGQTVTGLDTQDNFTGQVPDVWGPDGLCRFNESAPDADTCLSDSSSKGRKAFVQNWSGTTVSLQTGHLGRSFRININNPLTEKTYLKVANDNTLFSSLGKTVAVGGWFMPTTYSVGNTFTPLLNTRYGPGQPIFYLSLHSGKPRLMLYDASGTLILDQDFSPSFSLSNGEWYFLVCLIKPNDKTAQYVLGSRTSGETWISEVVQFTGELNRSCTADLIWGMHADSYWYSGNFDDWFIDCDFSLTAEEIASWFKASLFANAADSASDVDGLTTAGAVILKASGGVYPASGILTTKAVSYGIIGACYLSVDSEQPEGTGVMAETSTSDDLITWSEWAAPDVEDKIQSVSANYIRFRVTLTTSDTAKTPKFKSIRLSVPGKSSFKKLVIRAKSRWR